MSSSRLKALRWLSSERTASSLLQWMIQERYFASTIKSQSNCLTCEKILRYLWMTTALDSAIKSSKPTASLVSPSIASPRDTTTSRKIRISPTTTKSPSSTLLPSKFPQLTLSNIFGLEFPLQLNLSLPHPTFPLTSSVAATTSQWLTQGRSR